MHNGNWVVYFFSHAKNRFHWILHTRSLLSFAKESKSSWNHPERSSLEHTAVLVESCVCVQSRPIHEYAFMGCNHVGQTQLWFITPLIHRRVGQQPDISVETWVGKSSASVVTWSMFLWLCCLVAGWNTELSRMEQWTLSSVPLNVHVHKYWEI